MDLPARPCGRPRASRVLNRQHGTAVIIAVAPVDARGPTSPRRRHRGAAARLPQLADEERATAAELDTRLAAIPGRPPNLTQLGRGCAFAPRCSFASDQCRNERPELTDAGEGHTYACWHPLTPRGERHD